MPESRNIKYLKDKSQFFVKWKWKQWKPEKKTQKWQKITKKSPDLVQTLIVNISGYKQYFLDLSNGRSKSFCSQSFRNRTLVILTNGSRATAI